tara:strand:- start:1398 stop:1562 length:165 start_codon:yes stop_codon:yes gene_type:complete
VVALVPTRVVAAVLKDVDAVVVNSVVQEVIVSLVTPSTTVLKTVTVDADVSHDV